MDPQVTKQSQVPHLPMDPQVTKQIQVPHLLLWVVDPLGVLGGEPPKIEMLFSCWSSQDEDQQHERRNRESEVCRAVALVYILHQAYLATRTGTVPMGRSIPLAIRQKSGIPFPAEPTVPHLP
jgi:hypothetical protein